MASLIVISPEGVNKLGRTDGRDQRVAGWLAKLQHSCKCYMLQIGRRMVEGCVWRSMLPANSIGDWHDKQGRAPVQVSVSEDAHGMLLLTRNDSVELSLV